MTASHSTFQGPTRLQQVQSAGVLFIFAATISLATNPVFSQSETRSAQTAPGLDEIAKTFDFLQMHDVAGALRGLTSPPTLKMRAAGVTYSCPVDAPLLAGGNGGTAGGGMINEGWDGLGQNAVTIEWHVNNTTNDFGAGQRQALIDAMQIWANFVQITFEEVPVSNLNREVEWAFYSGDHCSNEPSECGDSSCEFDGVGGVLAHAGFPPNACSACICPMPESFAGNVHFDSADAWEQTDSPVANDGKVNLTLVAAHELGHALGLLHDTGPGGPHIMRPTFDDDDPVQGVSPSDFAHIREGYAGGVGQVITLEQTGVFVNFGAVLPPHHGTAGSPFISVADGVSGVPPFTDSVHVKIVGGDYPESLTITKAMFLERIGSGSVIIGN